MIKHTNLQMAAEHSVSRQPNRTAHCVRHLCVNVQLLPLHREHHTSGPLTKDTKRNQEESIKITFIIKLVENRLKIRKLTLKIAKICMRKTLTSSTTQN